MKNNRYKQLEQLLTLCLLAALALFVVYLIAAGRGITWLKILSAVLCFVLPGGCLWLLYSSKELLKSRSLWLSMSFGGIVLCTLVSLLVHFPG